MTIGRFASIQGGYDSIELLSPAEMVRADALTIAGGTSGFSLMRAAGRAVADATQRLAPAGPILIVAGRGNNGGDGFVAATHLAARGRDVSVALLCARESLQGDAARAAEEWTGAVLPFDPALTSRQALIVDAIFGAGLSRPVKGDPKTMIDAINASGCPVLAVDLPSGIDGLSGRVLGVAVRATETVTFFRRKPGHLLMPGRTHCGEVRVADIGIGDAVLDHIRPDAFANGLALWHAAFPVPTAEGHKYRRGHAVVVSGDLASTGAARLAARGALRCGAGLVTVASPTNALAVHAATLTAVMVRRIDGAAALADLLGDERINACVLGPGAGIGEQTRAMVKVAIGGKRLVVLDADALTSFADTADELFAKIHGAGLNRVVLTPHEGEFKQLFNQLSDNSNLKAKHQVAREAAEISGAIVILKGADTVVAAPDGRVAITANAPPWLATAGSGDVLAGMIGAMLAQGVPAFEAACIAVWMHGEAANEFGPGLISEDLPDALPAVFRRLDRDIGGWRG